MVDGDRGVVYTHKDMPIDATSLQDLKPVSSVNGRNVFINGAAHAKTSVTSNGLASSNGAFST